MIFGSAATATFTAMYALAGLDTPLSWIGGLSFFRGCAVGVVFVTIQTAVYATTSLADTARATSVFNTGRQVAFTGGIAIATTVIAARLPAGGDAAAAADRLGAYRWGFLACAIMIAPAALMSLRFRDADVAATRGLEPAPSA